MEMEIEMAIWMHAADGGAGIRFFPLSVYKRLFVPFFLSFCFLSPLVSFFPPLFCHRRCCCWCCSVQTAGGAFRSFHQPSPTVVATNSTPSTATPAFCKIAHTLQGT